MWRPGVSANRSMRRSLLLVAIAILSDSLFAAQQPPPLLQKGAGPGKPLSPDDARQRFKIDDGLRVELVACEPQIESPVAMAFDPDGRLWVVEMRDYPNGPAKGEKPAGRIRILEDKDGDGFFETAATWADNLLFANGLLLWKDGAIVTMAPEVVAMKDGRRFPAEIAYRGFAEQNPQLRVSHPILGPDGWITCANGLRGGNAALIGGAKIVSRPVELSGLDFRFNPTNPSQYESTTGPGQYGNTFDEWGNRFVCDNRHHLRHVVMENRYLKRNPALAAPALLDDISVLDDGPLSSGGKIYPLSKNWTTSSLHEGRFTAACGVFLYHGNLLDQNPNRESGIVYRGAAFTCDPTGNLVHMEMLTPKGATFTAKPHKQGVEFLATDDDWFRPVFLTHGPEGAMYVVDMYRAVIEHPEFMPPELKNRPDLLAGKDKGRIWRIVPKGQKAKAPRPNLAKAPIDQLVKTLAHDEPWWRTTAQRLLLEKNDAPVVEPLRRFLRETKSPHAKILAAWLLDRQPIEGNPRLSALEGADLEVLLVDSNPRVVEAAIKIAEPRLTDKGDIRLLHMVSAHLLSTDGRVRFQAILSTNPFAHPAPGRLRRAAAFAGRDDRWCRLGLQCAEPIHNAILLTDLLQLPLEDAGSEALLHDLGATVGAQSEMRWIFEPFAMMAINRERKPARWAGLAGIAEGLERRGKTLTSILKELDPHEHYHDYREYVKGIIADAEGHLRDANRPEPQRLQAIRFLSHATWPVTKRGRAPGVDENPSPALRLAAARALASQPDKEVPAVLLTFWPSAAPAVRREILEGLLRQPSRVPALLDAIEAKRVRVGEIDPLRVRQLSNLKDAGLRERAKALLAGQVPADRTKVLAEYQPALALKADAKNGREVFKKNCAACHRVAGLGVDVGPDIADTRTKTPAALLNDILAPNAAIDANYINYVISTKDGRSLTGLLGAETASSVALLRAEKQSDTVLRADIEDIASTGVSLMPDGLEKSMSIQEMADLLRFLKDWRYLDGSVPSR
jgi:putative membrane-bound dehydrogenase-like protein